MLFITAFNSLFALALISTASQPISHYTFYISHGNLIHRFFISRKGKIIHLQNKLLCNVYPM